MALENIVMCYIYVHNPTTICCQQVIREPEKPSERESARVSVHTNTKTDGSIAREVK